MVLLDFTDHIVSNLFLPISGLLIALLTGWHLDRKLTVEDVDPDGSMAAEL